MLVLVLVKVSQLEGYVGSLSWVVNQLVTVAGRTPLVLLLLLVWSG